MTAPPLGEPDRVIGDSLRFRQRLRIGRKAFRTLQVKDLLQDTWDTTGVAWSGAALAQSSIVATTFFAPTGVAAWLGLATAATPVGWVVAAAAGSAGIYYLATRGLAADERFVDEIPKFISTPLDVLGARLFELMAGLALKFVNADGQAEEAGQEEILEHLVSDWGYDEVFARRELGRLAEAIDRIPLTVLAEELAGFQAANPDCNGPAMQAELLGFVEELIGADGFEREQTKALAEMRLAFGIPVGERRAPVLNGIRLLLGKAGSSITAFGGEALHTMRSRIGA